MNPALEKFTVYEAHVQGDRQLSDSVINALRGGLPEDV